MLYGRGGVSAPLEEQCWILVNPQEYIDCVMSDDVSAVDDVNEQNTSIPDTQDDVDYCGNQPTEPDMFARVWNSERKECICPSNTVEDSDGRCVLRKKFYCEIPAEFYRVAGVWNTDSKQCSCPDGYMLDDKWRKGSCINKKLYECEFTGSVSGNWNTDDNSCTCPSGFVYNDGAGCVKDCLKLTLSCNDYDCVGQVPKIYIKQGNPTAYSDADCTNVITTLPIPTEKETGYQCDLLSFSDGIICADTYDGNGYTDKLYLDLATCLSGYEWQGQPKDLYHETTLQYRCGFCLIGYKYDNNQKKCVKISF
jgi:hypothetical protein